MCFVSLHWIKFLVVVLDRHVFIWEKKKWLLVMLDRWSSYTVTIVREIAWADSVLVTKEKWLSYRGDRLNRFDCNALG